MSLYGLDGKRFFSKEFEEEYGKGFRVLGIISVEDPMVIVEKMIKGRELSDIEIYDRGGGVIKRERVSFSPTGVEVNSENEITVKLTHDGKEVRIKIR